MNELSGATVFVTGAGGFLGRHVTRALAAAGARVRMLYGPVRPSGEVSDTGEVYYGDICTPHPWERGLLACDVVVHLAGMPSVARSFAEPEEYVRVHVSGTAALLEAMRRANVARLVHISSAEVYGIPHTNPVPEDHPVQPRSPYAAAKAGAEKLVEAWHWSFGQCAIVLRPFSMYGPGASEHSLLSQLLAQCRQNRDLEVYDAAPVRDYCFVEDFTRAVVLTCAARISFATFNVGTMRGYSVHEVATGLLAALGRSGQIRTRAGNSRPADILSLIADNRKASAELGWEPRIGLEQGLRRLIDAELSCGS
jgi:nucleoside-diphosphate-sugar epimerase